jgi:hypothetical protein
METYAAFLTASTGFLSATNKKSTTRSPEERGPDQISFVFCSCNRGGDNGGRWRLALLLSEDLKAFLSIQLV